MGIRQLKRFSLTPMKGGKDGGVFDLELTDLEKQYAEEARKDTSPREETPRWGYFGLTERVIYRPFRQNISISQGFKIGTHPAYDWPIPSGTELFNCFPGRAQITFVGKTADGYANNIRFIYPEYKYMALFAHGMPVSTWPSWVKVGNWLDPLQLAMLSDNTGNSTGPHVHMEIRVPPYTQGYGNCINFWEMLMELPTTPPPVDPNQPPVTPEEFEMPEFPVLPMWELTTTQQLAVRQLPGASSRLMGYLDPKNVVPAMSAHKDGNDIWLRIGYNQYIAAVYHIGGVEHVWGKWAK